MASRPIHVAPINFLSECSRALLAPYQVPRLMPKFYFNYPIESRHGVVVPDFHIDLYPKYKPIQFPIPVWIAECGFTQSQADMKRKLEKAVRMFPEIDTALMISIREPPIHLPESGHPLFSRPELQQAAFTPTPLPHSNPLPSVVVEDVVWVNVNSVNIYAFIRGEDGNFDFSGGHPLSARGTLFPTLTMQSITEMLHLASRRLLLRMTYIMEQNQDDQDQINNLRTASEDITFPVDWPSLLQTLRESLYHTAWSRYLGCLQRELKNKQANDQTLESGNSSEQRAPSDGQPSTSAVLSDHTS